MANCFKCRIARIAVGFLDFWPLCPSRAWINSFSEPKPKPKEEPKFTPDISVFVDFCRNSLKESNKSSYVSESLIACGCSPFTYMKSRRVNGVFSNWFIYDHFPKNWQKPWTPQSIKIYVALAEDNRSDEDLVTIMICNPDTKEERPIGGKLAGKTYSNGPWDDDMKWAVERVKRIADDRRLHFWGKSQRYNHYSLTNI